MFGAALASFLLLSTSMGRPSPRGSSSPTPFVLWHGMGDTANSPDSMGAVQKLIEDTVPGAFVLSVSVVTPNNDQEEAKAGFIGNVNEQIDKVGTPDHAGGVVPPLSHSSL